MFGSRLDILQENYYSSLFFSLAHWDSTVAHVGPGPSCVESPCSPHPSSEDGLNAEGEISPEAKIN